MRGGLVMAVVVSRAALGQCEGGFARHDDPVSATGVVSGVLAGTVGGGAPRAVAFGSFTTIAGRAIGRLARLGDSGWEAMGNPDGPVVAAAALGPGMVVAGPFTTIGGRAAPGVAVFDGSSWGAMGEPPDGEVRTLVPFGGSVLAFGAFTRIGGVDAARAAAWDGSSWRPLAGGWPSAATVNAWAVWDGLLVLAVNGNPLGTPATQGLVAWDGAGWRGVGGGLPVTGINVTGRLLAAHGGSLVVQTSYGLPDGTGRSRLDAWDGAAWRELAASSSADYYALRSHGGKLYAARPTSLMSWDGSAWSVELPGTTGPVIAMAELGGDLVATGPFTGVVSSLARRDGSQWRAFGTGTDGYGSRVWSAAGSLFVTGGSTRSGGGVVARGLCELEGGRWREFGGGVTGGVSRLLVDADRLWAAGLFTAAGGVPASNIAVWDGSAWDAVGGGADGSVSALARFGALVAAGGSFTHAGGVAANCVALWDGSAWAAAGPGFNASVSALAVYQGALYAAGSFTRSGSAAVTCVARWDGTSWVSVGPAAAGTASALRVMHGRLYAAGSFAVGAGGGVASWDGAVWSTLGTGIRRGAQAGTAGVLAAVGPEADRLLVAGSFSSAGGLACSGAAVWDGSAWSVQPDAPYSVGDALWQGGVQLGVHTAYALDDQGRPRLYGRVSVLADGGWSQPWGEWNSSLSTAVEFGGRLVVGGGFTRADAAIGLGMLRWAEAAEPSVSIPTAEVRVDRGGDVEVLAEVSGVPAPGLRWARDGVLLEDGPAPSGALVSGSRTARLRVEGVTPAEAGVYSVRATNGCGEASATARVRVCGADFNQDGFVDFFDYADFVACFEGASCPPGATADVGGDGFVDFFDYLDFTAAFEAGC